MLIEALALLPTSPAIVGGHPREPDLQRATALAAARDLGPRVEFTGLHCRRRTSPASIRTPTCWCCRTPRPKCRRAARRR